MNSDRLNESLEALFREIKRVQAAKRAAPPPPPPRTPASPGSAPPPPPPGLSALDQRRLLKAFAAGVTAFLGGLALAMYMTYGAVTPCGALYSKARSTLNAAVVANVDTKSDGAAIGSGLALMFLNAIPVESIVDGMLIKRFGRAGQLECTLASRYRGAAPHVRRRNTSLPRRRSLLADSRSLET